MRIAIIGTGNIGGTLEKHFKACGHDVKVANTRGPLTVDECAKFGDVVVLAVPFRIPEALPKAEVVAGKIVIDAMNAYQEDGTVKSFKPSTSSEQTLKRLPKARLVKAFNTIWSEHLAKNAKPKAPVRERHAIPLASDDADGIRIVSQLITEIGFAPVVTGGLHEGGRKQEPGSPIYNKPMPPAEMVQILKK